MADELTWMPAWQIRELIGRREVSPVEVTEHFLGRIEEHNPTLKAVLTLDAEGARAQAKAAEAAVVRGDELGPLHGIPMTIKEHIAVAGLPQKDMVEYHRVPTHDDLSVARLRKAGVVILGMNAQMGSGFKTRTGYNWDVEARNPWDPGRTAGWSSAGGAASAVAALVPIALGSDGGGSTRLPAAYSGVVGIHSTPGLIPWVDYSFRVPPRISSIGPLARNVRDAAIALQAMAGPDGRDFVGIPYDAPDMLAGIDEGVEGMRFAWTDDYGFTDIYAMDESPRVIATVREAAQGFRSLGATVETTDERWEDFWPGLAVTNRLYGAVSITSQAGDRPEPEVWQEGLDHRQRNWERFRRVLTENDLILSVTAQIVAPKVEDWDGWWTTDGARFAHGNFAPTYCSHTFMFNWLAMPTVSMPCGFVDGLPVGLQIVGLPGSEAKILRAANAFQKAFPRDERPPVS